MKLKEPCQASNLCSRPGRFDILDRADGKRWKLVCAIHERQIGRRNLVLAGYNCQQIEIVEKEFKGEVK
mgnify:CR=1 FL=1